MAYLLSAGGLFVIRNSGASAPNDFEITVAFHSRYHSYWVTKFPSFLSCCFRKPSIVDCLEEVISFCNVNYTVQYKTTLIQCVISCNNLKSFVQIYSCLKVHRVMNLIHTDNIGISPLACYWILCVRVCDMSSHVFRYCVNQHDGTCLTQFAYVRQCLVTDRLYMHQSRVSMKCIIWVLLQSNTNLTNQLSEEWLLTILYIKLQFLPYRGHSPFPL